ncbi:MAG: hypothetical protein ACI9TV_002234 [Sulfurimonas sp.]|jgi:hypothetical protein|uniref:hypothetical protein n=1 Tax=Sulfurimonas sp. TaxID=2022749 RepID=UPI0039E43267
MQKLILLFVMVFAVWFISKNTKIEAVEAVEAASYTVQDSTVDSSLYLIRKTLSTTCFSSFIISL